MNVFLKTNSKVQLKGKWLKLVKVVEYLAKYRLILCIGELQNEAEQQ